MSVRIPEEKNLKFNLTQRTSPHTMNQDKVAEGVWAAERHVTDPFAMLRVGTVVCHLENYDRPEASIFDHIPGWHKHVSIYPRVGLLHLGETKSLAT